MLFVNRIAFILHDIVVQCSGSANKNIGDAFLLAWKIDDKMSENTISILADKALLAFLKTLIEISRHQKYICSFSAGATERLLKRFPDYNVRIGSGLHVGWAIEGEKKKKSKVWTGVHFIVIYTLSYLFSPLFLKVPFFTFLQVPLLSNSFQFIPLHHVHLLPLPCVNPFISFLILPLHLSCLTYSCCFFI